MAADIVVGVTGCSPRRIPWVTARLVCAAVHPAASAAKDARLLLLAASAHQSGQSTSCP
jgi:hypothetical protein